MMKQVGRQISDDELLLRWLRVALLDIAPYLAAEARSAPRGGK
jgi:hypothetical protein